MNVSSENSVYGFRKFIIVWVSEVFHNSLRNSQVQYIIGCKCHSDQIALSATKLLLSQSAWGPVSIHSLGIRTQHLSTEISS